MERRWRGGAHQKTNMPLPRTSPTAISRPLGPLRAADTIEKMSDDPLPMAAVADGARQVCSRLLGGIRRGPRNVIPATLSRIPRT